MNTVEFSREFDILYNNIMSNSAPGLNEYEKSVFLTKAQDELIKTYFNPYGNKYRSGIDDSVKRQMDLSELITTISYLQNEFIPTVPYKIDDRSIFVALPSNLMLILNEKIDGIQGSLQVIPVSYDEYQRLMMKPFKSPKKRSVWRLVADTINLDPVTNNSSNMMAELITDVTITKYVIRYVRRPKPIILANLHSLYGNVSICDEFNITECELNPIIHAEVLNRAVELAKVSYTGNTQELLTVNTRQE